MKLITTIFLLVFVPYLVRFDFSQNAGPKDDKNNRFQKIADSVAWKWSECKTNPFKFVQQGERAYELVIHIPPDTDESTEKMTLEVRKKGQSLLTLPIHESTVIGLAGNHLCYVAFAPSGRGGEVVQIDLTNGKELWRSSLRALPPRTSFSYVTRFNLELPNTEHIYIWGKESAGRYLEIKDADTGETVGYKLFPKDDPVENK